MARAKVVHSDDACTVIFAGNKSKPEPSTGAIKFPGGVVEVSRTSDGDYWAHLTVFDPAHTVDSRIDYDHEGWLKSGGKIPGIPMAEHVSHMALRVSKPSGGDKS